jgi:hypothetical protein
MEIVCAEFRGNWNKDGLCQLRLGQCSPHLKIDATCSPTQQEEYMEFRATGRTGLTSCPVPHLESLKASQPTPQTARRT